MERIAAMALLCFPVVLGANSPRLEPTTPPQPFQYSFSAGRSPGGSPDRYVEQEGDEAGVVRGSYSYLDPNWEWQKVSYVADDQGFHVEASNLPVVNPVAHPQDTRAVAKAKANHRFLYEQIAMRNSKRPTPPPDRVLLDTRVVADKKAEHAVLFAQTAAEHARIAEEHRILALQEEEERKAAEDYRN